MKNKKGQLQLGNAPGAVLIVLFLFMIIGTAAYILEKYSGSFGASQSDTITNETFTAMTESGVYAQQTRACNFKSFAVSNCVNASNEWIDSANYSVGSDTGLVKFISTAATDVTDNNNTNWKCTYTYKWAGTACNVTTDLNTNISDNTSIAGMVLVISLIGIILSILIGLFYVFTRGRSM